MPELSNRIKRLKPSPVRDILQILDRPGMISFAGGLPAQETFPEIDKLNVPIDRFQYGSSEGDRELRSHLATVLSSRGLPTTADQVIVLSGSQQGIDLVAKLFIDEGTRVAVESPTYLAALQVFDLFGADYLPFTPGHTNNLTGSTPPSLTYAIPNFQNPTGHVYTMDERERLAASCDSSLSVLFEDDPYGDLVYETCDRRPVCSLLKKSSWVYQSSLSKTLAPGLRLGFLTCSPDLMPSLVQLKQAADLHSNRISQHLALSLLRSPENADRLKNNLALYKRRRDRFNTVLQNHFADLAEWESPKGGLFFWLTLKKHASLDTRTLLPAAISQNIAFMPGEAFFPGQIEGQGCGSLRLNFSHASLEQAEDGLARLADLFRSV